MIVFVNEKQIKIFVGAKVMDALRYVFVRRHLDLNLIDDKYLTVYDGYGNEIALDGPLCENKHIFYKITPF